MAERTWTGETDGDFDTNTNWTGDAVPGIGDVAIIPADATVNIDGGIPTASIDELIIENGCAINIGSRANGVTTFLQLTFVTASDAKATIGGTGIQYLDLTEAKTILVTEAGTASSGQSALNLKTTTATNDSDITINGGSTATIGLGALSGLDADAAAANIFESEEIRISGGIVTIGRAATLIDGSAALEMFVTGGTVTTESAIENITQTGGEVRVTGGGILTKATIRGGVLFYNTDDAALADLDGGDFGLANFDEDPRVKTVTQCELSKSFQIIDTNNVVTWTAGVAPQEGMTLQAS